MTTHVPPKETFWYYVLTYEEFPCLIIVLLPFASIEDKVMKMMIKIQMMLPIHNCNVESAN